MSQQEFALQRPVLDCLRPQLGLPTGIDLIDDFLVWRGIPQSSMSLLHDQFGQGATTLWKSMMDHFVSQNKKVFWLQTFENTELNFSILKGLIQNSFFEILAISICDCQFSSDEMLLLQKLLIQHRVSLVVISSSLEKTIWSNFQLVIDCQFDFLIIKKALHRPTPFYIPHHMMRLESQNVLSARIC